MQLCGSNLLLCNGVGNISLIVNLADGNLTVADRCCQEEAGTCNLAALILLEGIIVEDGTQRQSTFGTLHA